MGYSVVTTVLAKAASYDLTDLATAKVELQIDSAETSDDAWLSQAITQVSAGMARYAKRVFAPELVLDSFDIEQDPYPAQTPGGFAQLMLSRFPVVSLISVVQTLSPGVTQTLVAGVDFRLDPESGRLLRLSPYTGAGTKWEAVPVAVQYVAGYGELVSENQVVSATDVVMVAQVDAFACDAGVTYASGASLTPIGANPLQGQYAVCEGAYTFAPADAGATLVVSYAVADIPADLAQACLQLVTSRYDQKDRDSWLVQEEMPGVGSKRFWIGGTPGQKGPYPPDITAMLDEYRVPSVA